LALAELLRRCPEVPIHFYGHNAPPLPFPVIDHGLLTVGELDALYNQCAVGLSLSLTNVSLVPWEMLASGCIPVVNDASHNRIVLANDHVVYAPLEPTALALRMADVLNDSTLPAKSRAAAASVATTSWDTAGDQVAAVLRRELSGKNAVSAPTR
jgi:hypothetical protein